MAWHTDVWVNDVRYKSLSDKLGFQHKVSTCIGSVNKLHAIATVQIPFILWLSRICALIHLIYKHICTSWNKCSKQHFHVHGKIEAF